MLSHRLLRNMVSPACKQPCQSIPSHISWPECSIDFGGGSGSLPRRIRSAEMASSSWKADDMVPISSPASSKLAGSTSDANHNVAGIISQHKIDDVATHDVVPFSSSAARTRLARGTSDANINVAGAISQRSDAVMGNQDSEGVIHVEIDAATVNKNVKNHQFNVATDNECNINHSIHVATDTENSIHNQIHIVTDNVDFIRSQLGAGKIDYGFFSQHMNETHIRRTHEVNSSYQHITHLESVDINSFHVKSSGPDNRISNVGNNKTNCCDLEFSQREILDIHLCPDSCRVGDIPANTHKGTDYGTRKRSSDTNILGNGPSKRVQCLDISNIKVDDMNIFEGGTNNKADISNSTETGTLNEINISTAMAIDRNIEEHSTSERKTSCGSISNTEEANCRNGSRSNDRNSKETCSTSIFYEGIYQNKSNRGTIDPSHNSPLYLSSTEAAPSHSSPLSLSSTAAAPSHSSPLSPSSRSWLINESMLIWIAHRTNWNPYILCNLSCVCKKAAAITQRVLWRQFCLSRAPKMVSDLIRHSRNSYIDGGWQALGKLFLYCAGCRGGLGLQLPVPGHFVRDRTRFSKTSGRAFLIPQCRTDTLYISDPCEHPNEPEYVGIFRGVFKGFDRSRTKWLLTTNPWIHFDDNEVCPYCNARVWSMGAARMIPASASARLAAYDGNVEYFVCLNGHVNGKCAILPLSDTDSSD